MYKRYVNYYCSLPTCAILAIPIQPWGTTVTGELRRCHPGLTGGNAMASDTRVTRVTKATVYVTLTQVTSIAKRTDAGNQKEGRTERWDADVTGS